MRAAPGLLAMIALITPLAAQESDDDAVADPARNPVETSPAPEARPDGGPGDDAVADAPAPSEDAVEPTGEGMRDMLALPDTDYDQCLADLAAIGAEFTEIAPIIPRDDPDCGILRPVELSALLPGIAFRPPAPLRCPAALAAARWTRDFAIPAAERLGRGRITAVDHGSTYVCRRRNNQPDGKPSEHSFGNAIDVMGFRFSDGEPVVVQPRERDGTRAEAFQDAVRATACLEFTTVLGPGSDDFHDDHLHMDVVERNGDFRLCQ